jgi:hypothetical protein
VPAGTDRDRRRAKRRDAKRAPGAFCGGAARLERRPALGRLALLGACLLAAAAWPTRAAPPAADSAHAAPRGLEAARAASMHYWQRRRIVSIQIDVDSTGLPRDVRVLADHGPPGAADSLLAVVRGWRAPREWLRWRGPRPADRRAVAAFALDRTESQAWGRPGAALPAELRRALADSDLACWMQVWQAVDARFSAADFIAQGSVPLREERWPADLLRSPALAVKSRYGLLLPSPGGRWVLDPFQGIDVDARGRLGYDVDTGYAIYDARTGERWFYDVGTTWSIAVVAWLGPERLLLAGSMHAPNPVGRSEPVWVPFLREVRLDERIWIEYLGAPLPPFAVPRWAHAIETCRQRVYPRLPPQGP